MACERPDHDTERTGITSGGLARRASISRDFGQTRKNLSVTITVRPMTLQETARITEYFHSATPEHLEMLGVDPTRLPAALQWQYLNEQTFAETIEQRNRFMVSWLDSDQFIGF